MRRARNGWLTAALFFGVACGVEKLEQEELVDRVSMRIDGEDFLADSLVDTDGFDPETVNFVMGLDDTKADPKRSDPNWEYWVYARDGGAYRFQLNTRAAFGTGTLSLGRSILPREGQPHLALVEKEGGEIVRTFHPVEGSEIEILEAGGEGSRLSARFDRIVLRDECDNEVVLEEGEIEVGLVTTETFEMSEFVRLEDYDGIYPEQVEGTAQFRFSDGSLNDLAPLARPDSRDPVYNVVLINWCGENDALSFRIPEGTPLGRYPVGYDPDAGEVWMLWQDFKGTPFSPNDDHYYLGVSGEVELEELEEEGGFVAGRVTSPVEFWRFYPEDPSIDEADKKTLEVGFFRAFITP